MKFSEAMKLLEKGKKVRRVSWADGMYIYNKGGQIIDNDGILYSTSLLIDDWEEYIEPETKKIEPLDYRIEEIVAHSEMEFVLIDSIKANKHKINEIIDKLNKLEG